VSPDHSRLASPWRVIASRRRDRTAASVRERRSGNVCGASGRAGRASRSLAHQRAGLRRDGRVRRDEPQGTPATRTALVPGQYRKAFLSALADWLLPSLTVGSPRAQPCSATGRWLIRGTVSRCLRRTPSSAARQPFTIGAPASHHGPGWRRGSCRGRRGGSGRLAGLRPLPEVVRLDVIDVHHLDQRFLQRGCGARLPHRAEWRGGQGSSAPGTVQSHPALFRAGFRPRSHPGPDQLDPLPRADCQ
jgi:hypothetical protein